MSLDRLRASQHPSPVADHARVVVLVLLALRAASSVWLHLLEGVWTHVEDQDGLADPSECFGREVDALYDGKVSLDS